MLNPDVFNGTNVYAKGVRVTVFILNDPVGSTGAIVAVGLNGWYVVRLDSNGATLSVHHSQVALDEA